MPACSQAKKLPVRPQPTAISSAIRCTPIAVAQRAHRAQVAGSCIAMPAAHCTSGSTITRGDAGRACSASRRSSSAAARARHVRRRLARPRRRASGDRPPGARASAAGRRRRGTRPRRSPPARPASRRGSPAAGRRIRACRRGRALRQQWKLIFSAISTAEAPSLTHRSNGRARRRSAPTGARPARPPVRGCSRPASRAAGGRAGPSARR